MLGKEFTCQDGTVLARRSRWIRVWIAYNLTPRHSLYYYRTDENGYRDGQTDFNPAAGTYCDYFVWNGRKWALDQFLRMSCGPHMFTDTDGKLTIVGAYDGEDYHNPIEIEIDDCGEYVRVYQETGRMENGRRYYY